MSKYVPQPMRESAFLKKSSSLGRSDLLYAIDESPQLHDPYSDLNLFLSKKIQKEMPHCSNSKRWSSELQNTLLQKITPEFQKRFPNHRLGVAALKQNWEKVQDLASQIRGERQALTQDGKLNLPFFIKEHLRRATRPQNTCPTHPCHYAHQLAAKMGECIAVVDGIRPRLDRLTRTIWSLQRHLIENLAPEHFKSPYDENSKADKLIVKAILEITAKHPTISQIELSFHVQKRLFNLHALTSNYTQVELKKMLSALFADHCHFTTQRMEKILEQTPYPIAKCLKSEMATILIDSPHFGPEQVVEEAFAFFEKAAQATREATLEEMERKVQNWTIQSDLLIRWVRLNRNSALFTLLEEQRDFAQPFEEVVAAVHQRFLTQYPRLAPFAQEIKLRAWIYWKHLFYTQGFDEGVPTYDRFLHWHKRLLDGANLPPSRLLEALEATCKKMLPLMPFNQARAQTIVIGEKEKQPQEQ